MSEIVTILVDEGDASKNAQLALQISSGHVENKIILTLEKLDEYADLIGDLKGPVLVLNSPDTFSTYRGKLYQMLSQNKNIYPSEVMSISAGIKIPRWSYISEYSKVASSAKLGLMTYVGCNTTISPNASIGSFVWIGNNVNIGPGVIIGNNVTLHDGLVIGAGAVIDKFNELRHSVRANSHISDKRIETEFFGSTAYLHGV